MLDDEQTQELKDAGLTAYNHNLDTSEEYYGEIVTTRTYKDRLDTIARVAAAGISVCAGGIIGMGESIDDRMGMLVTLANLSPQPESVPVNALVAVPGTPLDDQKPVDSLELVRMCATARIMMPGARVRLSAGQGFASAAKRSFFASWAARTASSLATSSSRPETRTTMRTSSCCAKPGFLRSSPIEAEHGRYAQLIWSPHHDGFRRSRIEAPILKSLGFSGGLPIEFDLQLLAAIKRACSFATAMQSTTTRFAECVNDGARSRERHPRSLRRRWHLRQLSSRPSIS